MEHLIDRISPEAKQEYTQLFIKPNSFCVAYTFTRINVIHLNNEHDNEASNHNITLTTFVKYDVKDMIQDNLIWAHFIIRAVLRNDNYYCRES